MTREAAGRSVTGSSGGCEEASKHEEKPMPLFDRVKSQAAQLAQKAQEAGKVSQAKLGDVQAHRRADRLMRDLGALVFAERSGRASGGASAEIERIVAELSDLEAKNGPLVTVAADEDSDEEASDEEASDGPEEEDEEGGKAEDEPWPPGGFTLSP